jgi:nucleoside-diphosphate-sugar epimerase
MSRVTVVGATGFVGTHVMRALLAAGHEVSARPRSGLTTRGADRHRQRLDDRPPAAMVNCAGLTHGTLAELQAANVELVADLLRQLVGSDTRFVQIGSAAEYGPGPLGVPITEDHPARPVSDYGATKLAATGLILDAARDGLVSGAVLRVFNAVGAGSSEELLPGRAAHLLRLALQDGGPVRLGPLAATRDFVDMRDVADVVVAAVSASTVSGQILNVGSGQGTTARELVRLLAEAAGYTGPILEAEPDPRRPEGVDWQVADISRTKTLLGWVPRRTLREAVDELWSAASPAATTLSKIVPI